MSNAAIIGKTESKLDDSVPVLRCDKNRNGGGVACFVRDDIGFSVKNCLSKGKSPSKVNFLGLLTDDFFNLLPESNELYILGDFNINLFHQGINVDNITSIRLDNIPSLTNQYKGFCSVFGLSQIIQEPTHTTCNTLTVFLLSALK